MITADCKCQIVPPVISYEGLRDFLIMPCMDCVSYSTVSESILKSCMLGSSVSSNHAENSPIRNNLKMRRRLFLMGLFLVLFSTSCAGIGIGERGGRPLQYFLQIENRRAILSYDWIEVLETMRDKDGVIVSEEVLFEKDNCSFSQDSPDYITFIISTRDSKYHPSKFFHREKAKGNLPASFTRKLLRWAMRVNTVVNAVTLAWDAWEVVEGVMSKEQRDTCRFRVYYSKDGKVTEMKLIE